MDSLPPSAPDAQPPRLGDHRVTVEFDKIGLPTLHFRCHEPEGSLCRTACRESECEEGCVDPDGHVREPVDYCNIEEWLNNTDDVESAIYGSRTSITARVEVDWMSDGVDWRFA